ncbi:unnamed protein product [Parajaminaea phylloscopi]
MAAPQPVDAKILGRFGNGKIKNIICSLSGKGGVGKSSVATQLALSISAQGKRVGLLDIDLTGPSQVRMCGLEGAQILQSSQGWLPAYVDKDQRLAVMSVAMLLKSKNDSVVWRGPKKNAMIKQFLGDVRWGELDYLIIDTPPGTSDEHISLMEYLRPFSPCAIMVTTPQAVSLADNLRSLDFCNKVGLPVIGLIENMSGYVCPHCSECTNVWGKGGGESLAAREGIRFLGRIPIDPGLVRVLDDAKDEAVRRVQAGEPARGDDDADASSYPREARAASRPPMDIDVSAPLPAPGASETKFANGSEASEVAAATATPAGTMLSRTLIQRYKDSQTFPIFAEIAKNTLEGIEAHARRVREDGDPVAAAALGGAVSVP